MRSASSPSPERVLCTYKCNCLIALTLCRLLFSPQCKYSKFLMTRNSKAKHLRFCTNMEGERGKGKKKGTYMHTSSPETGCKSKLKEVGWKNDPECYAGQCYCGQERPTWILWALHTASSTAQSSPAVSEVPQERQHQYCVFTVTSMLQLLQTAYSFVSQL